MLRLGEKVRIVPDKFTPIKENGYNTEITAENILTISKITVDGRLLMAEDGMYVWNPGWVKKITQSKLDEFLSQL